MITAAYIVLTAAAALFGARMVAGPTMADRVVALNGLLVVGMSALLALAVDTGRGSFLPVLVVVSIVGFVGTTMVARYIEGRGGRR